ncbi:MAG: hypothetical protein N3A71_02910 [Candidatus Dojkabacteria bacterium]|nr:hypothetical protein [Candidatus Dojkabacteria bacterium]
MNDQTDCGLVSSDLLIKYKQLEEKERQGTLYIKRRLILQIIIIEIINLVLFSIKYNFVFKDLNAIFAYLIIVSFTSMILFAFLAYYNIQILFIVWISKLILLGIMLYLDNYSISFTFLLNLNILLFLSAVHSRILYIISVLISLILSIISIVFLNKLDFIDMLIILSSSFLIGAIPIIYLSSEYRLIQLEKNKLKAEILSLQNQELISGWGEFFKSK